MEKGQMLYGLRHRLGTGWEVEVLPGISLEETDLGFVGVASSINNAGQMEGQTADTA